MCARWQWNCLRAEAMQSPSAWGRTQLITPEDIYEKLIQVDQHNSSLSEHGYDSTSSVGKICASTLSTFQ